MFGGLAIAPCAAAQSNGTAGPAQEVIPLYAAGPRALAMLTLGDGPPAPVVFDTGEDKAWLVAPFAKRLGLKVIGAGPLVDEATGKTSTVPLIELPAPKISGVPVTPIQFSMVDYEEPDMVGVFGPGAFTGRLVTLELSHHRARIAPLTPENIPVGKASPYFHALPAMMIDVAGIPALAHLDSGSTLGLGLGKGLMSKLKLKTQPVVIGQARSVSGAQDLYGAQIDGDVRVGPLTLHDPEVVFAGDGERANVGYDIVRQLVLVMDPAGQRSWVFNPADLSGSLAQFAGTYGVRTVRFERGRLGYRREGGAEHELRYLGGDLFDIGDAGDRIQFRRKDGSVSGFDLITADGQVAHADRDL
jgi:hypothetical protein